jgi:hypothetical protein
MISATNGYEIAGNIAKSEKLKKEVEEFYLSKMGEIGFKVVEETKKERKEKRRSPQGKIDRLNYQKPMLERAKKAFGFQPWKKLSDAIGNIVSSSHLGCIYRGDYSMANMDIWSKIEKAIKDQEKKINVA